MQIIACADEQIILNAESVHSVNYNAGSELSRKWQLFLGKVMRLLGNPCRHHCCNYRGPLSIMSPSQSRCEDIVAHKHSRDFRMWCARVQWITAWGPHSRSRAALIYAYICQQRWLRAADGPSVRHFLCASCLCPHLLQIAALSHSVTVVCHFLSDNGIFLSK